MATATKAPSASSLKRMGQERLYEVGAEYGVVPGRGKDRFAFINETLAAAGSEERVTRPPRNTRGSAPRSSRAKGTASRSSTRQTVSVGHPHMADLKLAAVRATINAVNDSLAALKTQTATLKAQKVLLESLVKNGQNGRARS